MPVELDADKADEVLGDSSVLFEGAAALRASAKQTLAPSGLSVYVTGPGGIARRLRHGVRRHRRHPARRRARRRVADPADRLPQPDPAASPSCSPRCSGSPRPPCVIYLLAKNGMIALNGQSQGILFILVVGAATDYALLLVSRYREELHDHPSKWRRDAGRLAGRVEPIAASAATVILGLLCLLLSDLNTTRPRPGRRDRHRRRVRRRADLAARRPAAARPAALLARCSRVSTTCTPRTPWAAAASGGGWPAWSAGSPRRIWVVTAARARWRCGGVRADVQGRRRHRRPTCS